jgi:hypothetical protein
MSHSKRVTEIFDQFKKSGIEGSTGNIRIELAGLSVKLETKDIVGGAIQEWFENWLVSKKIKFDKPTNTQSFPDFLIEKKTFLEVKCFDSAHTVVFSMGATKSDLNYISGCPVLGDYWRHCNHVHIERLHVIISSLSLCTCILSFVLL